MGSQIIKAHLKYILSTFIRKIEYFGELVIFVASASGANREILKKYWPMSSNIEADIVSNANSSQISQSVKNKEITLEFVKL